MLSRLASRLRQGGIEAIAAIAVVFGIGARFVPRSALWLDEALSVNIASEPLGDIVTRLKADGHPPLYYVLLHGWIKAFGSGDYSVRLLSVFISIVGMALVWHIGRHLGRRIDASRTLQWALIALFAVLPYGIRYATETRMYSLVIVEVLAGVTMLLTMWERPSIRLAVGVGAVTAALLWTHYWSMWLVATVGLGSLWAWWRGTDETARRAGRFSALALIAGGLAFVPWLPILSYQSEHTGTPWGSVFRPATVVMVSLFDFAGGANGEAQLNAIAMILLMVAAVFGAREGSRILIGAAPRTPASAFAGAAVATLALGWLVSFVTGSTFASRYAAVVFPLVAIVVALGVAVLPRLGAVVALATVVALSMGTSVLEVRTDRTGARDAASAIRAADRPNAIVLTCPDQLAVAVERELGDNYPIRVFPDLDRDPRFVDWIDYAERNAAADPKTFVDEVERFAAGRPIFLVISLTYRTLERPCAEVASRLQSIRPSQTIMAGSAQYYESMTVLLLDPPASR